MTLVPVTPETHDITLDLAYGRPDNVAGFVLYTRPRLYLHAAAEDRLRRAIALAAPLGLRLHVFDGWRPTEVQWLLWNHVPGAEGYIADPRRGSPHSRGVAIDLTLARRDDGQLLEMGTAFDDFSERAHHARTDISVEAQRNRALLLGIMTAAGWDNYMREWWHYQLFNSRQYPLYSNSAGPEPLITA